MFYANFVLAKKGPLARVWLAAHWEKKLSKAHVFETDLQSSVESIITPKVKIALRTSGHLLLGVVRIYSRKAKYLLADCTEALIKIKMAFRPEIVDLPIDNQKAAVSAITLPEFQEFDALVSDLGNFDVAATLNLNTCRVEEITMKEDLIGNNFITDDQFFGDTQFGEISEKEIMRDAESINESVLSHADSSKVHVEGVNTTTDRSFAIEKNNIDLQIDNPLMDDGGFGAGEGMDFLEGFGAGADTIAGPSALEDIDGPLLEPLDRTITKDVEQEHIIGDTLANKDTTLTDLVNVEGVKTFEEKSISGPILPSNETNLLTEAETLLTRDEEALALEPVEVTVGADKKRKRKRKLVVDDEKMISGDLIRSQLNDTSDIIKAASVAPPTKLRMLWYESSAKSSFAAPIILLHDTLCKLYGTHMTHILTGDDVAVPLSQDEDMELEPPSEILRAADPSELGDATREVTELEPVTEEEATDLAADQRLLSHLGENDEIELEPIGKGDLIIPPPFELEAVEEPRLEKLPKGNVTAASEDLEEDRAVPDGDRHDDLLDRRWSKRTQQTLHALDKGLKKKNSMAFSEILSSSSSRKQVAFKFYTLLILNKERAIHLRQEEVFGPICITKGERFSDCV